jgi:RNA polymerase sigma factor (sigma-70 family)
MGSHWDGATDEQRVQAALTGDRQAFEALVKRHFGTVYAIALARLRDPEMAEDLAQDVFLRVFLHIGQFDPRHHFGAWVGRIARNLAIDWLRRGQRASRLLPRVPLDERAHAVPDTADKGARETMAANEESIALRRAILDLPAEQREVVLLHFSEEMTQSEIAERLGVHQATVSRHLKRALAALRGALEPALRREAAGLRPPARALARSLAFIAAASALSATAQASLAAGAPVGGLGSAASMAEAGAAGAAGLFGLIKSLPALITAAGKALLTVKGIAAAAVALAAVGGGVYLAGLSGEDPLPPGVQRATLRSGELIEGGFDCFLSFTAGVLPPPPDPGQVDLVYYFDADDCSQGALIGHSDSAGYLFPIGHRSWSELAALGPPSQDSESVAAISPITKDEEGLAFWVRTSGGDDVLARIRAVEPASYSDLVAGGDAAVELEWINPTVSRGAAGASAPSDAPRADVVSNSLGMRMVAIPAGSFEMGLSDAELQTLATDLFASGEASHRAELLPWIQRGFPVEEMARQVGANLEANRALNDMLAFVLNRRDRPVHRVTLDAFRMSATEVTVAQYMQFVQATGHRAPEANRRKPFARNPNTPITGVSWDDAMAFCAWLTATQPGTYCLPTEAEWEYACRAGTTTLFAFGDALRPDQADYSHEIHGAGPMDVASFAPNAWGLYDMHGNVAEWCLDSFDYAENFYERPEAAGRNPINEDAASGDRVVRGGSWVGTDLYPHGELCHSSGRFGMGRDARAEDLGFRVVWFDAEPSQIRGAATMAEATARAALPPPDADALHRPPEPLPALPPPGTPFTQEWMMENWVRPMRERVATTQPYRLDSQIELTLAPEKAAQLNVEDNPQGLKEILVCFSGDHLHFIYVWSDGTIDDLPDAPLASVQGHLSHIYWRRAPSLISTYQVNPEGDGVRLTFRVVVDEEGGREAQALYEDRSLEQTNREEFERRLTELHRRLSARATLAP